MEHQNLPHSVVLYYTVQLSWYIYTQITHMTFDVKRKDYYPMLIHHFVTIILIIASWIQGYVRMGMVIFVSMDLVDVFLEMAKFFNYLRFDLVANVSFMMLVLSWIGFRLMMFPLVVIRSVLYDVLDVHTAEGYDYSITTWRIFMTLLIILLILQIYWFGMVMKALLKMLSTGKVCDVTDKEHAKKEALKKD